MNSFFCNKPFDKGELKRLIHWFLITNGAPKTLIMIDKLKTLGFHYATKAGISLGIEDLKIPPVKPYLLRNAENEIRNNEDRFLRGKITAVEHSQKVIDIWNTTSEVLKEEVVTYFRQTDLLNPVYMMAFSGARGNISQVRQLVGMRGLMSDSQGEIIALPIKSNFREGLTVTEYIISCYGARKGLVDTALKTANSGYLTRRLVDVAQAVIVHEIDCNTPDGIFISALTENNKTLLALEKRLVGRVLAQSIEQPVISDKELVQQTSVALGSQTIAHRNQDICSHLAKKLGQQKQVFVRSPLTCQTRRHVCQMCYGWNLAHGHLVDLGEAVGIIAAQSIGEPGTQLTMRTFHTGGVFASDVADRVYSPHTGILQYNTNDEVRKTRTTYGQEAIYFTEEKELTIYQSKTKKHKLELPPYTLIFTPSGKKVYAKQIIAEFSNFNQICQRNQQVDGIETRQEVQTKISGQIFFQSVQTLPVLRTKTKKLIASASGTTTVLTEGLFFVLFGQIFSATSVNYQLSEQGDFIHHWKDMNASSSYLSESQKSLSFKKHQLSQKVLSSGVTYQLFKDSIKKFFWVPSWESSFDCYADFSSESIDLFNFNSHVISKERGFFTNRIWTNQDLKKVSQGCTLTKHLSKAQSKTTFLYYCYSLNKSDDFELANFALEQTFPNWVYLPRKNQKQVTKRSLKKLFANNVSLIEPYSKTVDSISFNETIFIEWLLRDSSIQLCTFKKVLDFSTKLNLKNQNVKSEASSPFHGPLLCHQVSDQTSLSEDKLELANEKIKGSKNVAEILYVKDYKQYLLQSRKDQISFNIKGKTPLVRPGDFVCKGNRIAVGLKTNQSGVVYQVTENFITLRRGDPYRVSKSSSLEVTHNSLVYEGNTLFELVYKKAKTEDIVQGLPKIEELLEARKTKDLKPILNSPHDRLKDQFESYKKTCPVDIAAKKSLIETQQFLVDRVQKVYQAQGVDISDKHIEIIVKQMTSKVFIEDGGSTSLLCGDLIEFDHLKKISEQAILEGHKLPTYEPIILGITKASLKTESFLSAASFQETTRVLTQAAIQGKLDSFRGLKENVIIGQLIPAGTGFLV